jgi:hypothetical protein
VFNKYLIPKSLFLIRWITQRTLAIVVIVFGAKFRARLVFIVPIRTFLDVAIVFLVATLKALEILETHIVFLAGVWR